MAQSDLSSPSSSPPLEISLELHGHSLDPLPEPAIRIDEPSPTALPRNVTATPIRQAQLSDIARSVLSNSSTPVLSIPRIVENLAPPTPSSQAMRSDTPLATAPSSPRIRATTIDVPGLTSSKVSPDGRISNRDIGAKLVIVMVGLPARGKSYVTKKLARYLNWLQHDTKIFNVGNRRRVAAASGDAANGEEQAEPPSPGTNEGTGLISADLFHSLSQLKTPTEQGVPLGHRRNSSMSQGEGAMDQSAAFFDPSNKTAAQIREKVALDTLDELLDYVMYGGGSVGILDATNSNRDRRKAIVDKIRQRAGSQLGIIFLESECHDEKLLEANMRLKLQGPDYKGMDPVEALADFKKRVKMYESTYQPLGEFEEKQGMPYIKMIDVGRKVITHQIRGFLAAQTVYFLLNFHLSARQIWITRHGESTDNVDDRIGGDASLSPEGERYAGALTRFVDYQRKTFYQRQLEKHAHAHMPPRPGDTTPPNPEYTGCCQEDEEGRPLEKSFCVWTSMLKRSIETAKYFDEDIYDIKQMRMLNELNAGNMENHTYAEIREKFPQDFELRRRDKLHYRYPGAGGESYLDVINRLRAVIVEVERMQDHVLLVAHRVVARVLLAYFLGLKREDVARLDVPLGILYMLEPKPYGVEFKAYKYNRETDWFDHMEDFQLKNEDNRDVTPTKY